MHSRLASSPSRLGLAFVLATLVVLGCGGHGHHSKTKQDSARLLVAWPSGRAISRDGAAEIQDLDVTIMEGTIPVAYQNLTKPAPIAAFENLSPGEYSIQVAAHATTDDSGPVVARVEIPLTIVDSKTVDVHLSLIGSVDRIECYPSVLTLDALAQSRLIVTPRDAQDEVVFSDAEDLSFVSSDPTIATIISPGLVTAGATEGRTTVQVSDAAKGLTAQSTVVVLPPSGSTNSGGIGGSSGGSSAGGTSGGITTGGSTTGGATSGGGTGVTIGVH